MNINSILETSKDVKADVMRFIDVALYTRMPPCRPSEYLSLKIIDGNGDGTFQIELWNDIEMRGFGTNKDYIRQYLTYLVVGGFIEVGKYRTMGNLYHYDDRVEVKYSVCKEVNDDPQGDDVWIDVKSKFRFK